jgi:hypothetical protein
LGVALITPPRKKFLVTKPHIKKLGYVRWQTFSKNCKPPEDEEEEDILI